MLSRRALTVIHAADDNACSRLLGALGESFIAHREAVLRNCRDIRAQRKYLRARGHNVVGGDIVADLERYAAFNGLRKGLVHGERLDIRTAQNFYLGCLLGRGGRNYHIVIYQEFLRHYIGRHIADSPRVGEHARNSGYRRGLGRNKVYLTVFRAASSLKVAVEGSQGNTL